MSLPKLGNYSLIQPDTTPQSERLGEQDVVPARPVQRGVETEATVLVQTALEVPSIACGPVGFSEPRTGFNEMPMENWYLSLEEAVRMGLQNTEILRSLGGTVITNPQSVVGTFDPAIQSTDPNFGIAAALSEFDAQVSSDLLYTKNDDVFNNPVLGGGAAEVRDDVTRGTMGLRKTSAFGTQFSVQSEIQHSNSSNPSLLFPDSWNTLWEGTVRQPLLQGRGVEFNQIAGPNGRPGLRNSRGVVISKINHEISIAQFEAGLRNMVLEIIDAYWQLDLAYERLQASKRIRDLGYQTWKATQSRFEYDLTGGAADQEALARSQYYQFESQVNADLTGDEQRGQVGILRAEANLRRLLGLPQGDGRLICPLDEPFTAPISYAWENLARHATNRRVELREQSLRVKQREAELIASRNFLLPRLDLIGTYRNNGFGDNLFGSGPRFSSAFQDAVSNDHGELEFGVAYELPIGYRQAHAAVRNASLQLNRERAILQEQREQIRFELGNAVRALYSVQADFELQANRAQAAKAAVSAREAAFSADAITIDQLLEAHQRLFDAERAYYNALLDIQQAQNRISYEAGELLSKFGVVLTEAVH